MIVLTKASFQEATNMFVCTTFCSVSLPLRSLFLGLEEANNVLLKLHVLAWFFFFVSVLQLEREGQHQRQGTHGETLLFLFRRKSFFFFARGFYFKNFSLSYYLIFSFDLFKMRYVQSVAVCEEFACLSGVLQRVRS